MSAIPAIMGIVLDDCVFTVICWVNTTESDRWLPTSTWGQRL